MAGGKPLAFNMSLLVESVKGDYILLCQEGPIYSHPDNSKTTNYLIRLYNKGMVGSGSTAGSGCTT